MKTGHIIHMRLAKYKNKWSFCYSGSKKCLVQAAVVFQKIAHSRTTIWARTRITATVIVSVSTHDVSRMSTLYFIAPRAKIRFISGDLETVTLRVPENVWPKGRPHPTFNEIYARNVLSFPSFYFYFIPKLEVFFLWFWKCQQNFSKIIFVFYFLAIFKQSQILHFSLGHNVW